MSLYQDEVFWSSMPNLDGGNCRQKDRLWRQYLGMMLSKRLHSRQIEWAMATQQGFKLQELIHVKETCQT
jgi:hypothetical protein